jgi:hypothetical protein
MPERLVDAVVDDDAETTAGELPSDPVRRVDDVGFDGDHHHLDGGQRRRNPQARIVPVHDHEPADHPCGGPKFCPSSCEVPICRALPSRVIDSRAIVWTAPANRSRRVLRPTTTGIASTFSIMSAYTSRAIRAA